MNITKIRSYKSGDDNACQELNQIVMKWQRSSSLEKKEDLSNIQKYFIHTGGCFFVAEQNGSVVGMIGNKKIGSKLGFMKRFKVHPDVQGKGIGRQLLEQVLAWMKEQNMSQNLICTGKREIVAHHLYESIGAIRKGEVNEEKDYLYELNIEVK